MVSDLLPTARGSAPPLSLSESPEAQSWEADTAGQVLTSPGCPACLAGYQQYWLEHVVSGVQPEEPGALQPWDLGFFHQFRP